MYLAALVAGTGRSVYSLHLGIDLLLCLCSFRVANIFHHFVLLSLIVSICVCVCQVMADDLKWRVRLAAQRQIVVVAKALGAEFFREKMLEFAMSFLTDHVCSLRETAVVNILTLNQLYGLGQLLSVFWPNDRKPIPLNNIPTIYKKRHQKNGKVHRVRPLCQNANHIACLCCIPCFCLAEHRVAPVHSLAPRRGQGQLGFAAAGRRHH